MKALKDEIETSTRRCSPLERGFDLAPPLEHGLEVLLRELPRLLPQLLRHGAVE